MLNPIRVCARETGQVSRYVVPSRFKGAPLDDGFTIGFWACAGVGVLAILAALAAPSRGARRREAIAAGVDDFDDLEHAAR